MAILRVGVLNNFNYTNKEFKQLEPIKDLWLIFVNSNSFVKIKGDLPAIVTVNPYLDKFIKPKGKIENIKAIRIKYVSDPVHDVETAFNKSVAWSKKKGIPILITYIRFINKRQLFKYTKDQDNYVWINNFYRQKVLKTWKDPIFHYCDLKDKGCKVCRNCAKLTYGFDTDQVYGINLSSSGKCKFDCPSCYAHRLVKVFGIKFDEITRNRKQRGKL